MEYSPKKMNELLEKNDFNFKKKFGQNFIVDENIINSIINKSEIDNNTLVIEIGVGAAFLTYYTAKAAKYVLGYEIDESLKEIINDQYQTRIENDMIVSNIFNELDYW